MEVMDQRLADRPAAAPDAFAAGPCGGPCSVNGPRLRDDAYKRPFDLGVLLFVAVLFAPVWLVLALALPVAVKLGDGGPVFYRQRRLGRGGAPFELIKFRTMPVEAEHATGAVWPVHPVDGRATRVGRWLRRLRLDELPQAVNVLRGEMSLVGPRPERPELAARCEREARGFGRRLAVRPGIAGLAQARRGALATPRQKLRYDLLYIRAMGPCLDLRLCAACAWQVLREALGLAAKRRRARYGRRPPPDRAGFLRYQDAGGAVAGLNHMRRNLECLLAEAHRLGRRAVLPPLRLAPGHNLGTARDWRWDAYFDLAGSVLVDRRGRQWPLPVVRSAPETGSERVVAPGKRCPQTAATLLTRPVRRPVWRRDLPRRARARVAFRWRPSERVAVLAAPVIAALAGRPGGFVAVHVRRGDRLFGPMRWLTAPARIRRRLKRLGVADGAALFALSDERCPAFWQALGAHYELWRYDRFPALAALVRPGGCPDNYLLYEVEKAVMRAAALRVETFPGRDYEPSDAVLVPWAVWLPARLARRTAHAGLRLGRRLVGDRRWRRARSLWSAWREPRREAPAAGRGR